MHLTLMSVYSNIQPCHGRLLCVVCGLPQRKWPKSEVYIWERIATGLNRPQGSHKVWERGWQSAVQLRADCQAVILIVANRGIGARSLVIEWNPAPAILHREAFCLKHRIFLIRDFTSLKLICGVLFKPKLNTNGLSWHTISWHYTFKRALLIK
jgi:hypothetical protein